MADRILPIRIDGIFLQWILPVNGIFMVEQRIADQRPAYGTDLHPIGGITHLPNPVHIMLPRQGSIMIQRVIANRSREVYIIIFPVIFYPVKGVIIDLPFQAGHIDKGFI